MRGYVATSADDLQNMRVEIIGPSADNDRMISFDTVNSLPRLLLCCV